MVRSQCRDFSGRCGQPVLQSADMQPVGGDYDSADPAVIQQHVAWLERIGVDAALIEVTKNVSCIFNSEQFAQKLPPNCTPRIPCGKSGHPRQYRQPLFGVVETRESAQAHPHGRRH
jgi:hypothetical protein